MNMTPEPCPTREGKCCACKGYCCRNLDLGYRVEHMGAAYYEHTCGACKDGTKYVPPRTPEDERADVIAFLEHAAKYPTFVLPPNRYIEAIRDLVVDGSHVGAAKKKPSDGV
jgi:hypothetical protein